MPEKTSPATGLSGWALPTWATVLCALLCIAPFAALCLASQGIPAIHTIFSSFWRYRIGGGGMEGDWTGLSNYIRVFGSEGFPGALMTGFLATCARLLLALPIAILPSIALSRMPRIGAAAGGILAGLPLALWFSPAILIGIGAAGDIPGASFLAAGLDGFLFASLLCGLLLPFVVAAFREREAGKSATSPLPALVSVIACACAASAISGPRWMGFGSGLPLSPGGFYARLSFSYGAFEQGAVVAFIALAWLSLLGITALVIAQLSGLRWDIVPRSAVRGTDRPGAPKSRRAGAAGIAFLAISALLLLFAFANLLFPYLSPLAALAAGNDRSWSGGHAAGFPFGGLTVLATFVMPVLSVFFCQLPLAWLAAFGIGALRPLGRHSEWLLLPFAALLFAGEWPLSMSQYLGLRQLGLLSMPFAWILPGLANVSLLFILAFFFKGRTFACQAEGKQGGRDLATRVVLPSLLPALFLGIACSCLTSRASFWPWLLGNDKRYLPVFALNGMAQASGAGGSGVLGRETLVWDLASAIFTIACLAGAWLLFADRIRVRVGKEK